MQPAIAKEGKAQFFVLAKENYRIEATLYPMRVVLDTGAGPNCVARYALPRGWNAKMRPAPNYYFFDANGHPLLLLDRLKLVVQVGKCRVSADFVFVNVYQSPLF